MDSSFDIDSTKKVGSKLFYHSSICAKKKSLTQPPLASAQHETVPTASLNISLPNGVSDAGDFNARVDGLSKKRKKGCSEPQSDSRRLKDCVAAAETMTDHVSRGKRQGLPSAPVEKVKSGSSSGCDHKCSKDFASNNLSNFAASSSLDTALPGLPRHQAPDELLSCTVFVGNLPLTTKPKLLKSVFSKFGPVVSVRIRSVPVDLEGKMPRGRKIITGKLHTERKSTNAYIVFKNASSVMAATELNMQEFNGRHIRVDRATPPTSKGNRHGSDLAYDHSRCLFLGNLPYAVDEEEIIRFFHRSKEYPELSNSIEAVRIVRDRKTSVGKGIALVLFKRSGDSRVGLLLDRGKIGEREIRIVRAGKNTTVYTPAKKKRCGVESSNALSARGEARTPSICGGVTQRGTSVGAVVGWEGLRSRPRGKRRDEPCIGDRSDGSSSRAVNTAMKSTPRSRKRPAVAARKAKCRVQALANKVQALANKGD